MRSKKGQWSFIVKWIIIIISTVIIIAFLFYSAIPGIVKVMEKLGLIEAAKEPHQLKKVEPKTDEGRAAKEAFQSIISGISFCRAKQGSKCACSLNVPMFNEDYVIAFWSSPSGDGFVTYVYKGKAGSEKHPTTAVLDSYEFKGIKLCTAEDILMEEKIDDLGAVLETRFNLYRENNELKFYHFPASIWHRDEFFVLGTKEDYENEATRYINFRLYKVDDSHVCFFISRQGNSYRWNSGYSKRNINKMREKISKVSLC